MGVKFAVAMGAEVTVFSTSPGKEQDAKKLGAHHFVNTRDENAFKPSSGAFDVGGSFDLILDTVAAKHEIMPYINALAPHGVLAVVGAPPEPLGLNTFGIIMGNKIVYGELRYFESVLKV